MNTTKTTKEVLQERGAEYGSFRDIAKLTQTLKSLVVTSTMNDVQREAMGMICHKMARLAVGNCNSRDGWLDISGYANLVVIDLDRPTPEA